MKNTLALFKYKYCFCWWFLCFKCFNVSELSCILQLGGMKFGEINS